MISSQDAAHEFGALNTLLIVVVLGLCILAAYLIKQNSFYYLPESAAAILVGLIVGGLARAVYPSAEELRFLTFDPQIFFFLLLPPIIFEAGYSLKKKEFLANFWTISLFAVFGTIISTFVIGYLIYFVGLTGLIDIDISSPMEALMFGSLISAVDTVATLSILGNPELNCDPLLYSLVFGESVLNDAVAIVLFKTFQGFFDSGEAFSSATIPAILLNFSAVSLGSVFVGVVIGLVCSYLCKHTEMYKYPEYEISMLFLFAYGSYSFSEALQLSGIMSLFFCGLVMSHYNSYNLSATSQVTAHYIFKSLAVLSEFFVFLFIGMGIFTGKFKRWNLFFFVICIVFCLIGRFFNTFPLSILANLGRNRTISRKMQCVIWFAGLRGAISFALSLNMPGEHRDMYVSTTLSLVIFTTVVCGGLTAPMMSKMGMRQLPVNLTSAVLHSSGSPVSTGIAIECHYEKLESDNSPAVSPGIGSGGGAGGGGAGIGIGGSINLINDSIGGIDGSSITGMLSTDRSQQQRLLQRSFLSKFEQDYMNPIFGGPDGGIDDDMKDVTTHGAFPTSCSKDAACSTVRRR